MNDENPGDMKDEPPGGDVQQAALQQEVLNFPPSPEQPSGTPTEDICNNQNCPNVQQSEDRLTTAEKWGIAINAATAFFSLCAMVVAVGGVVVAHYQWRAMREQLADGREQAQRTLRPYVLPNVEPGPLVIGKPIRGHYYLINHGQTPALKTYTITGVFVGQKAMDEAEEWFAKDSTQIYETNAGPPIPPGVPSEKNYPRFLPIPSERTITQDDFALITARDYSVVIVSRTIYKDGFDSTHGTETCHMMTKNWEAAHCPRHNEMH